MFNLVQVCSSCWAKIKNSPPTPPPQIRAFSTFFELFRPFWAIIKRFRPNLGDRRQEFLINSAVYFTSQPATGCAFGAANHLQPDSTGFNHHFFFSTPQPLIPRNHPRTSTYVHLHPRTSTSFFCRPLPNVPAAGALTRGTASVSSLSSSMASPARTGEGRGEEANAFRVFRGWHPVLSSNQKSKLKNTNGNDASPSTGRDAFHCVPNISSKIARCTMGNP
jgi:hypothetical protein